ncbi:MAG: membrane protein insertion efficiency factor YidD [Clostridiales bacterium]|nr:membrane protein insertion efficiency factor YidD [Clostridiales bacterium]
MKKSIPARLALWLIGFYKKYISPRTPPSCRIIPPSAT